MTTISRRHDIDWLRVIAIGLLLIYHVAVGFQSWGVMIGFITNKQPWESLWVPMALLNVWRIPLLFFVSGMGVFFAMRKRSWKQLIGERGSRILLPFVFGICCIVPMHMYIWQDFYGLEFSYIASPGHLWFLGNIFCYVVVLLPLFYYLKQKATGKLATATKRVFSHPLGLFPVVVAFVLEALIINPNPYTYYAMTWHGFFLGLLAFLFGYCFVLGGDGFWQMILKWRWLMLIIAGVFYFVRLVQFQLNSPAYLQAIESCFWIFSVLGFGYKYLNRPGIALTYLSQAAYPVYIVHMIFLYLGSWLFFPLELPVWLKFAFVLTFTGIGCFALYEVIRRIPFLRPFFGLKVRYTKERSVSLMEE